MEWRRGFLALTGPPSLGQELEVGEAQSLQVAESFCLPGVSPCFLPPIFLSPSHIHSLPSPLQRGREAGPIPILEEKEGLPPPPPALGGGGQRDCGGCWEHSVLPGARSQRKPGNKGWCRHRQPAALTGRGPGPQSLAQSGHLESS